MMEVCTRKGSPECPRGSGGGARVEVPTGDGSHGAPEGAGTVHVRRLLRTAGAVAWRMVAVLAGRVGVVPAAPAAPVLSTRTPCSGCGGTAGAGGASRFSQRPTRNNAAIPPVRPPTRRTPSRSRREPRVDGEAEPSDHAQSRRAWLTGRAHGRRGRS